MLSEEGMGRVDFCFAKEKMKGNEEGNEWIKIIEVGVRRKCDRNCSAILEEKTYYQVNNTNFHRGRTT